MPPTSSRMARGYIAALLAAFFFGSNGTVAKVVLEAGITAAQLTFFRSVTTMIIAGIALLFIDRGGFRLSWRDFLSTLALGIVGVAFVQWFYANAIALAPVGIVLLIEYTAVVLVALVARFVFKEVVKPRIWWAIGLVLIGLAIVGQIFSGGGSLSSAGVLFAFAGAVSYAAYFVIGERQVGRRHPISVTFWSMLWAALFWGVLSQWWQIDASSLVASIEMGGNLAGTTVPLLIPLAWACTMGSFVPFALSYTALRYMPATTAGIIASSEIIWAFIVAWMWLGESLSLAQLAGVALVAVGIIFAQTARSESALENSPLLTGPITVPVPFPPDQERRS